MYKPILLFLLPLLAGCGTGLTNLVITKNQKEKEIAELRVKHEAELKAKVVETEQAKDKVIEVKDKQITAGANAFYAADLTFKTIISPTRTDLITNNYVNEGWTAMGKRNPDADTIAKINERLKNELDETKTSFAQLKVTHDAKVIENQKLVDESKLWQDKLTKLEKEKNETIASQAKIIDLKQTQIIDTSNKIIALEKERADRAADIAATKAKMAMIVGALALACVAGAIWSPVFKEKLGMGAAVLGIIAVGILYIQAWHVMLVGGVLGLGLIGWAAWDHFKEKEAATDVYRAIQSIKTKAKDKYDEFLKPELQQWVTKYDKQGRLKPNSRAENHIDKRLIEVGDK